jgi:predicted small secreted protein
MCTKLNGVKMKKIVMLLLVALLAGCGTVGGLVGGAGTDLQRAGDWIKSK